MAFPLGRSATTCPPHRLPTHSRRTSTSSTQSRLKPTQRGGRNLSLRYQQLESPVRSIARKVAFLERADSSRLFKQRVPLPVASKSQLSCEKVEIFHGLVVPQEPKPPEPDGESPMVTFGLNMVLKCLVTRMLYVRMCHLRLRSLRGLSFDIRRVTCFTSDATEIDGDSAVGVAFTHQVFTKFSGRSTAFQPKS